MAIQSAPMAGVRAAAPFIVVLAVTIGSWTSEAATPDEKHAPKRVKPPPLVVDTSAPLLLEMPDKKTTASKAAVPSLAANEACFVCHDNMRQEALVTDHVSGEIGCVDCHGDSYAHRNDENNTTPPDVMFPIAKIDTSCSECHETHNAPARQVIARFQQRRRKQSDSVVCTDCHGRHYLPHRTVRWDRATGKLLTDANPSGQRSRPPTPDAVK